MVAGALRRLGAVNQVAGFPDSQYLGLAHALLRAVRELSDDDWSTTLGSAWISYFQWIQRQLMIGAQQAPPPPMPTPAAGMPPGGRSQPEDGEPELKPAGGLLDEKDDEDTGYGQIMVSMTRAARREPPPYPE